MDRSIGQCSFADLDAAFARNYRLELAPKTPRLRTIAATHFQNVAKTFGGDDARLATLPFEQRVGPDRRAMNDSADAG
jgi:hypothetical protein